MHAQGPTVPRSFIAFAPYGVGVLCALFYFEKGRNVYGWWIGARDSEYHSAYFKLEEYFSTKASRFYATQGCDLYGGWRLLYSAKLPELDKPLTMDEDVAHELDRVQDMFVSEWLFFEDAPEAAVEREAYDRMNLPVFHVSVRAEGINRLNKDEPVWLYRAHDFDGGVLDYLARYWPLDYGTSINA